MPNLLDLNEYLNQLNIRSKEAILKTVNYQKLLLDSLKSTKVIKSPMIMFDNKKQKLDILNEKINNLFIKKIDNYRKKIDILKSNYILTNPNMLYKDKKNNLEVLIEKLYLVNPMNILKKGYSITKDNKNNIIKSINDVNINDLIEITLVDGVVNASVINVGKENEDE